MSSSRKADSAEDRLLDRRIPDVVDAVGRVIRGKPEVVRQSVLTLLAGGHLLIEAYHPQQLNFSSGGPARKERLIEAAQLQQELAALEPLILQEIERTITEGSAHQGRSAVVQFFGRRP